MNSKRGVLTVLALAVFMLSPIASAASGMSSAGDIELSSFESFYDQLGEGGQAVYDGMKGATPENLTVAVTLPRGIYTSIGDSEESARKLLKANVLYLAMQAKDVLSIEDPLALCTWGKSSYTAEIENYEREGNVIGVVSFKITIVMDSHYADNPETEKNELREKLDALNAAISKYEVKSSNMRTMVGNINSYLVDRLAYDPEFGKEGEDPYCHDAYGALVSEKKYAVCDGYSKGFQALCQKYEIKCYTIHGYTAPVGDVGHAWNVVLMDNFKWYPVDVTWNDTGKNSHLLSAADEFNTQHIPGSHPHKGYPVVYRYPVLSKEKYDIDPWYMADMVQYAVMAAIGGMVIIAVLGAAHAGMNKTMKR